MKQAWATQRHTDYSQSPFGRAAKSEYYSAELIHSVAQRQCSTQLISTHTLLKRGADARRRKFGGGQIRTLDIRDLRSSQSKGVKRAARQS